MIFVQLVSIGFGLFMAYLTFLHYKRKEFSAYQFIIWEGMFVSFIIVTLLPDRLNFLTEKLGISRAFDLFAVVAFVIILFLTFHNYLLVTKLEKKLETKVRDKALADVKSSQFNS